MLNIGSKIGIVCCSNALHIYEIRRLDKLIETLNGIGLTPICSNYIFQRDSVFGASGKERANALTEMYEDYEIEAVFDISGGDIANEILSYLDYDVLRRHNKPLFGYSDLTTVLNAVYAKTQNKTYLYQIQNLTLKNKDTQIQNFVSSIIHGKGDLFRIGYSFIQGASMSGIMLGGNIRCLLKLAGTPYMPDFRDKILFLESRSGEVSQMTAYFSQLKQMNVFSEIKGLLLGTFTSMQKQDSRPKIEDLAAAVIDDKSLPIAKTENIGHGSDSKCLIIGMEYKL